MKIVIVGAGAVGGVIAARLAQIGADVVCVARGEHGRVLRERGRIELSDERGRFRVALPCVERVAECAGDVYLVAVKSNDTAGVLAELPRGAAVVCAQNGVSNEALAQAAGMSTYGMMVWMPAQHLEPGVVEIFSEPPGFLRVGRWPRGADDTAEALASRLARAGFAAAAVDDVARWKWSKLVSNLRNAVDAYFAREVKRASMDAVMAEGRAVLDAAGIDYRDPEQLMREASAQTPSRSARVRAGSSMWQSVARGKPTEVEALNGTIVALAAEHGVAAPLNQALLALARDPPSEPIVRPLAELARR
ncbi:MAG: ketopantoate reductase family protein [Myxococcales bacterium]|nr:ketopantoate reductase family protein [Myxococcales bacterium]